MGLFAKFKAGLAKTHSKLVHEIKRIVTRSPKLTAESLEEIEHALIAADLGMAMTTQIVTAVKLAYESQGTAGLDYLAIARAEIEKSLSSNKADLLKAPSGPTVVSIVGVNGTGKTTTSAKLAHYIQSQHKTVLLAACDTFRAAAIEQLKLWGTRLKVEVIASAYGSDAASVAHDAVTAAQARKADYLFIDTAGRLHTKHNLMQELHKLHRVIGKQLPRCAARSAARARRQHRHERVEPGARIQQSRAAHRPHRDQARRHEQRRHGGGDPEGTRPADQIHRPRRTTGRFATVRCEAIRAGVV